MMPGMHRCVSVHNYYASLLYDSGRTLNNAAGCLSVHAVSYKMVKFTAVFTTEHWQ